VRAKINKAAHEAFLKPEEVGCMCFDMMHCIPVPLTQISSSFYKRQPWLYVEGVHMIRKDKVQGEYKNYRFELIFCNFFELILLIIFCFYIRFAGQRNLFCWFEVDGCRGSVEIGSTLFEFFKNLRKKFPRMKKVFMFSDSCSGQNKSRFIVGTLYWIANLYGFELVHYFLVPGHSYMPADSDFGKISQLMRKFIEAFELEQYIDSIFKAALPGVVVTKLEREDFNDLEQVK